MTLFSATTAMPFPQGPTTYDEVSVPQNMLLTDSLEDLESLRKQLYSAAEYFELSYYINHDQKQAVVNTLKDYALKALFNTVDHLGSLTFKANDMLEEKVVEVSGTELHISCIEQRLRTCQEYIDQQGASQQILRITTPKHYKRYILPGEPRCDLDGDEGVGHQFQNGVEATTINGDAPLAVACGKGHSPSPSLKQSIPSSLSTGIMPKRELEKRTGSPHRFRHLRTASLPTKPKSSRPTTPDPSRPPTPTPTPPKSQMHTSEAWKPTPLEFHGEREKTRNSDHRPSKSKRLLNALLSRHKSKNDDMLYTYIDEY